MRARPYLRIGCAAAMVMALFATGDGYSQRGKGGGKAAGHKAAGAPKVANSGPAMSRPAGGPKAGPQRDGPKAGLAKGSGGGAKLGGGPGAGTKGPGNFQRPTAKGPGDVRPGAGKIGGDARPGAKTADRPARPGGGASSAQLNDFLGGGSGRPGIGKGDRPDIGKKDDRPIIGKTDDRPIIDKKGDRPEIGKKDDRPIIDKKGDRPDIGKKSDRPDVVVGGDVNIGGGNRTNYVDNKKAWVDNRHATGNQVRINAGNRYANVYSSGAYRRGVVGGYPYYNGWASRGAYYGWRAASFATLGAFVGAAVAREPVYYAYGDGGNVYYEDNTVYVNGQPAGTAEQYAQQAQAFVTAAPPPEKAADAEWLPLGTFALTREDVEDSQGMIELAINKQGVLAGTYYNEATGVSRSVKGTLDRKSQRVAVGFADGKNEEVALETGIDNLTHDEAPALVHFGTTQTTPVLLVRLQPPE
jgi:hypothetical protein